MLIYRYIDVSILYMLQAHGVSHWFGELSTPVCLPGRVQKPGKLPSVIGRLQKGAWHSRLQLVNTDVHLKDPCALLHLIRPDTL